MAATKLDDMILALVSDVEELGARDADRAAETIASHFAIAALVSMLHQSGAIDGARYVSTLRHWCALEHRASNAPLAGVADAIEQLLADRPVAALSLVKR